MNDQYNVRLEKLQKLRASGYDPYQKEFERKNTIKELLEVDTSLYSSETQYSIAGRIRSKRMMGKAGFFDIEDDTGRIQFYVRSDEVNFEIVKNLDLGDIVGVQGFLFLTKTGEKTVHVKQIELLAKCLRPLPVVKEADGVIYDAFADKEQRYRMRYVDLIVSPGVREVFITRSKVISFIRQFLTNEGYLEVETPMMQPIPGGANARPFITHLNALDMNLYLRVAPELYLKRLLVGGFTKIFELNRNFRNEGISYKHNPEFTMLEVYHAYGNMNTMMDLCERLITSTAKEILGTLKISYEGKEIDLTPPWRRISYLDAIKKYAGIDIHVNSEVSDLVSHAIKNGFSKNLFEQAKTKWDVAEILFDEAVEKHLIQPTFITFYPKELSPLAKANKENPLFVDRFEPYIAGREIGNAFSELNDPFDQRERFLEQVKRREAGDEEAQFMDYDFLRALEFGMPPAGGLGIGIDRLVMILTNQHSIRDTIFFPLMRPEKPEDIERK
ncbi:MAG: lysine--tRNA ligase [Leptospiraceae bacterium]|nr:lysine--tRNA ligase [Leptospiraceae bacterium]MDW7975558.1 lysine--tRNA ligase [Leptospiraceae bacterium]